MSFKSGLLVAACLFAAVPAAAQDWALDIQPAECTLTRAVTEPAPMLISLWTRAGSQFQTLVIADRDMPELRGKLLPVTIQFGDNGVALKGNVRTFPVRPEAGRGITISGLGADFVDAFASAPAMSLTIGEKTYGPYPIPRSGGATRAFKKCVAEQLIEWGADPAQFAPGGKQPVPIKSSDEWISGRDLISIADGGSTFHAVFRISISSEGIVDGCERIDEKEDKGAEKRGCAVIMKQKVAAPATDPQGKPVRGVMTFEIGLIRRRVSR